MGIEASCCDWNRLITFPDSNTIKLSTDEEITEFMANNAFFSSEFNTLQQPSKNEIFCIKNQQKPTAFLETIHSYKKTSLESQAPEYSPSYPLYYSRIYSSNIDENSVNIIKDLHKSSSLCSTNFNSKSNSRDISPISRNFFH